MAKDFNLTLLSDQTPEQVFATLLDARGWWSGLYNESFQGETDQLGKEFSFRAGDGAHYTTQKLVEKVPNEKIVWEVTHSELSFLDRPDEWKGTKLIFEVSNKGKQTQVRFTHQGLTPSVECYDACAPAWTMYLQERLMPLLSS